RRLEPHPDERGTLRELWRSSTQPLVIRQALVTMSRIGALRGMHYHLRQGDLCYVTHGRLYMALVDLRGEPVKDEFRLDENESLYIPARVAHGYQYQPDPTMCYRLP